MSIHKQKLFQTKAIVFAFILVITASFLHIFSHKAFAIDPPFELPSSNELNKLRSAILYTEHGEIHFRLFPQEAPWHVTNLKYRSDKGWYKNTSFHLLEPNFLIQGGKSFDKRNERYSLPAEFNSFRHELGSLAMGRVPDQKNPERRSHASQFYITLNYAPHLNQHYTIFGQVTQGVELVEYLKLHSKIFDLKVFVHP